MNNNHIHLNLYTIILIINHHVWKSNDHELSHIAKKKILIKKHCTNRIWHINTNRTTHTREPNCYTIALRTRNTQLSCAYRLVLNIKIPKYNVKLKCISPFHNMSQSKYTRLLCPFILCPSIFFLSFVLSFFFFSLSCDCDFLKQLGTVVWVFLAAGRCVWDKSK